MKNYEKHKETCPICQTKPHGYSCQEGRKLILAAVGFKPKEDKDERKRTTADIQ